MPTTGAMTLNRLGTQSGYNINLLLWLSPRAAAGILYGKTVKSSSSIKADGTHRFAGVTGV